VIFVTTILGTLAATLIGSAQARIFESIYCIEWYRLQNPGLIHHGRVEEEYCKVAEVQSEVASLLGENGPLQHEPSRD
jgi:hypothetical protein